MLTPRELYRCQGFTDDYLIEVQFRDRTLPRSTQVKLCGNSVCPNVSEAIVRANCADMAVSVAPRKKRRVSSMA
jgi:DNA (cytosine-5)-methyltransferase 1